MGVINPDHPLQPATTSFFSLPPEVRNQIYRLLFPCLDYRPSARRDSCLESLSLAEFGKPIPYHRTTLVEDNHGAIASSCRQLCRETQLLFFETTVFRLDGAAADPLCFADRIMHVSPPRRKNIRHIILDARICQLRMLNETWGSLPFGHADVYLECLTLVPRRASTFGDAYAEIADLSQCHTLAYILTETLKSLRNVGTVTVRNVGCFTEDIWRLSYRSLVFRLWKWGGRLCDLRFKEEPDLQIFSVHCPSSRNKARTTARDSERGWHDVLQELNRLMGKEGNRDGMDDLVI